MNLFEIATRKKFRFVSMKGELSVEQLWDLKLTDRNSFDLDNVAKTVAAELEAVTDRSFVKTSVNPKKGELELKLEIVKHIISVRMAENEEATQRAQRQTEIAQLEDLLRTKRNQKLESQSEEEIAARLAELKK